MVYASILVLKGLSVENNQKEGFLIGNYVTKLFPHEVRRIHLGNAGMNPIPLHDSSSRVQMFCSHLGQKLVFHGVEENQIQSGLEYEFAKANFRVAMPKRGRILAVIPRYGQAMGADAIRENPETFNQCLWEKVQEPAWHLFRLYNQLCLFIAS